MSTKFVIFVGPSGCGKSTLMHLIAGLEDTSGGIIEIDGSPIDLYRNPRNKFVASFIGRTKMNFIEFEEASSYGAKTLGIRHDHIDVSQTEGKCKCTVKVAEHLGSDTCIHAHGIPTCDSMTVRVSGEITVNYGNTVFLTPNESQIHKFGNEGLRIA